MSFSFVRRRKIKVFLNTPLSLAKNIAIQNVEYLIV